MAAGYALLPTLDKPTSNLTYRLSSDEMKERNEWILGAHAHGMSIEEIATEVGLGIQRVKQLLPSNKAKKVRISQRQFKTPREMDLALFWANDAHPECARGDHIFGCCTDCFGRSSIIESCYDGNGWPYSPHLFEEFILPHMIRPEGWNY